MGDIHELVVNGKTSGKDTVLLDLNACLEHGQDTIGMNTCLAQAYKAYDKILNQVYQLALSRSDEETQKALKLSEQKWVAFRNAERGAQGAYGQSERGTILGIAIGYQNITAIRERIAELMFYLGADQG
jgi:uncharacterized protein YecT (DUF1311 family)